jgi:hypothetical protein
MHIYNFTDKDNPILSDIQSITKIKEMPWMYPSVTTVLGIIPNPFIDAWKVKRAIEIKGDNPNMEYEEIIQVMWGQPICPCSGDKIASSDFGIKAHDRVEKLINASMQGDVIDFDPYDDFAKPVIEYLEDNDFEPYLTEELIACHKMKIAGRLDLIAKKDDKFCLFDYKFRDCSGKDKGKFYDKDCYQLAIESYMWKGIKGINYMPDIYSICICSSTGRVFVKKWTRMMLDRGIFKAKSARDFYFKHNYLTEHI